MFTWTGFWSLSRDYLTGEPFEIPNTVFCTTVSILALIGLVLVWRSNAVAGTFFACVLFSVPLIYYISHPDLEYRHTIDPEIVILGTYAVSYRLRRRCDNQQSR